jgi:dihydrofolate reductase
MPKLSLIVAVARNGVIGRGGDLPWRLSADLKRFKRLTMGKTMIMGRKTFDSIGRLLPGRTTVVLTRQTDWSFPGARVAASLQEALVFDNPDQEEVFVIGGAQLYETALPLADRLYLTRIETDVEGDTHFPAWEPNEWQIVREESFPVDEKNEFETTFLIYERVATG